MNDPANRVAADADALRSAAQRLHDDAADPACSPLMPSTLDAIDDALTTLSRLCYTTAHAFVPLGNGDESVGERYTRAAANWPSPRSPRGPAHEQQARILTALHNAGAALRAAGAHCGRAGHELAITIEPVEGRSAAPAHRSQAA